MTDLNHVTLIGRLTRDAELKYTQSGFAISNFSIAVNRRRKNGEQWVEEAHFFDITLYGKSAESLKQYLIKGSRLPSTANCVKTAGNRTVNSAVRLL